MSNKAHLSIEGLNQIINLKASMNLGLSPQLKSAFANINTLTDIVEDCYANKGSPLTKMEIPSPY